MIERDKMSEKEIRDWYVSKHELESNDDGTKDYFVHKAFLKAWDEKRPHGEWKYESYGQYLSTYKCSNCGFHGDKQWISCPYCDAKMKEGEAE